MNHWSRHAPDWRAARAREWNTNSWQRRDVATRPPSWTWFVRGRNRLFAIALQILRDIDRAEDALQDALVIAWRDLRER
jgi:hypothetical protein